MIFYNLIFYSYQNYYTVLDLFTFGLSKANISCIYTYIHNQKTVIKMYIYLLNYLKIEILLTVTIYGLE